MKTRITCRERIWLAVQFLFLAVLSVNAQQVSIHYQNAPLGTVLNEVAHQTGYKLAYSDTSVDLEQKVSISVQNAGLTPALAEILKHTNLSASVKGGKIFLINKNNPEVLKEGALITVRGTVTDTNKEPLIGAAIVIKGKATGTTTDIDGRYSVEAPMNSTLEFSYMGYIPKNEEIKGRKLIDMMLEEDSKQIDEVVVIGYGAVRKSDLTGSVASVKIDELNKTTATLEQSLIGHTPGVEIKQTSGAPGSGTTIRIRGVNSIYGSVEPLYVIDGYPASKDVYINPEDVASIQILKDAASAAIYGSRASGGVVLITTKRGTEGKPKVDIDYQFSTQQLARKIKMMDAGEFRQLHMDGYNNNYFDYLRVNGIYADNEERWTHSRNDDNDTRKTNGADNTMFLCPDILATGYDTDWQDAVFSNAPMHRANFSVQGGKESYRYMFSLGYLNQEGIVKPSAHERITARINMDMDISERFQVNINSSMYYVKERAVKTDGLAFNDGIILNTLGMPPQYPLYNEDGSYATGWSYRNGASTYNAFGGENPVALSRGIQNYYTKSRYNINAELKYTFFEGFNAKINAGTQVANQIYRYYRSAETLGQSNYAPGDFENLARASNDRDFNTDWLFEATLNYNRKFGVHSFNAVAGYSMQEKIYDNIDADGKGYTSDRIPELSGAGPTKTDENGTSAVTDRASWSLMSYFGRAMYNYNDRYTLSATLRTDGCSRFGSDNRWGIFPSVSAGWNLSNEEFFKPVADLLSVKLRASWGISGNNNISNYRHIATIKSGSYNFGDETVITYYPSGFTDLNLGWEKTRQTNIGVDLGFFRNRLNLIANYYYSITNDLLYQNTVSAITGSTTMWTNLKDGKVYNKGFDIQIDGNIVATKDWRWNLGFNVSINRNKVMGLTDVITQAAQRSQITHITKNGLPIGSFYGLASDGLITSVDYALIQEDARHRNEKGYVRQGPPVANYDQVYIGDVKWRDVNGDGKITEDDRDIIGNNYPDFTFGLHTAVSWKGLSLSATFDGQYGGEVINFSRYYIANMEGGVNTMAIGNNRYRDEQNPGDGIVYRANRVAKNLNTKFSTYFVEDASYFRCTNLTLGYTVPQSKVLRNLNLHTLYLYASVDNLFTLTHYLGYNPDVDYNSGNLCPGIDFGTYPLSRTYSVGVKLSF